MIFFFLFNLLVVLAPASFAQEKSNVKEIISKTILKYGGDNYKACKIKFNFRDKHYYIFKNNGKFIYKRVFSENNKLIEDELNNSGFSRKVNGKAVNIPVEQAKAYSSSINSVVYFALLPYPLNDKAVKAELLNSSIINGKDYYKIKITFSKNGGGEDYNDIFIYWIDKKNLSMDYLAYLFHVDGGGIRFRKATNVRNINGIIFSDYINYKPSNSNINIEQLDKLFLEKKLMKVSDINLENINVKILNQNK